MVRRLQPINMLPPYLLLLPHRQTCTGFFLLSFTFSNSLSSTFFFLLFICSTYSCLYLSFSVLSSSLTSFLPSLLHPVFLVCKALMVNMYSSSYSVTSAGSEGLSLTTQPANEIFPHLINTIRILILTESI